MENEGIMALPMPGPEERGSRAERPTVTSADSYDAALTALGMANPDALAGLQGELGQSLAGIEIAPEELSLIIQMFEELINNPRRYKELRAQLIQQGVVDAEDLPEEYDLEILSASLAVLNELKLSQIRGAQAPMAMAPAMQEQAPPPMQMAEGGLADMAQYLASKGRRGDTMLAHITPEEAEMLKRMGGSGTINPETGLPEFFLKRAWNKFTGAVTSVVKSVVNVAKKVLENPVGRVLATVALATVLGPTALGATLGSAGTAALSAGAVTLAGGGSMKDALISGALGYIGGGGDFGGLGSPLKGLSGYLPGAAGSALNTGLTTAALGTGAGLALGMKPGEALRTGAMAGLTAGALQGLQGPQQPAGAAPQDAAAAQPAGAEGAVPASPTASAVTGAGAPGATGPIGTAAELGPPGGSTFRPGVGFSEYAASGAVPPKPGFFDNIGQSLSNTFSPNRPGLSPNAGFFTRYGPLMAAGVGAATLAGGMQKTPGEPEPLYKTSAAEAESEARRIARRQELEQAGYGLTRGDMGQAAPRSPVLVPTPSYAQIPQTPAPSVTPTGITNMPGGVAQPYNVSGLYGIPLLYGQQPVQRARGGEMKMTEFPRKTGPINGPGTGTSDSIPAMLSDGEFVFTAKAVRNAGNGSRRKGAARMYKLMKALEGGAVKA